MEEYARTIELLRFFLKIIQLKEVIYWPNTLGQIEYTPKQFPLTPHSAHPPLPADAVPL